MSLKCRCGTWTNNGILCVNCMQLNSQISDDVNYYPEEILESLDEIDEFLVEEDD